MRLLLISLLCTSAGIASAQCTPQASSWLTLEVVASEPAMDEAVELIDIDDAGCASIRYASFDQRAGLYRRQLSRSETDALAIEVAQRRIDQFDADAVRARIERNESAARQGLRIDLSNRFSVECGDTYRLELATGAKPVQIQWYAPKQIAARHRDVTELADLVALIERLQAVASDPGRTRIAELDR